jgi:hypothetical protein
MILGGRLCQCGCGVWRIYLPGLRPHLYLQIVDAPVYAEAAPARMQDVPVTVLRTRLLIRRTQCYVRGQILYSTTVTTVYMENAPISMHCKEPIPKIRNKYSQKKNCAATGTISTFSVSGLYIPTIDLPILLQEISGVWTDPEYM